MSSNTVTISRKDFDAAIFDLDGVLAQTARLHATAWKTIFDDFLRKWNERHGQVFRPFDIRADYLTYVDGLPRDAGIRNFLTARGISLPEGSERDPEDADTVYAMGARKTSLFLRELKKGISPAAGATILLEKLRKIGVKIAVASSSKNTTVILRAAGLNHQIDVYVDWLAAEKLGLKGKPDPALFLETARRLNVPPLRVILFEDALSGVEAGRRGGFGRVVGVNLGHHRETLLAHGADVIVQSLQDVNVKEC